jgi:phosphoribosylformimino-5-aminoimidazole carboxamide ribotide isomerase
VAPLHLIPVIDLLRGQVVHAREGRRSEYAPIQSRLCQGADPETIMAAILALHPFRTFYFADLDAIQCHGSNHDIFERLHQHYPAIELWVDTGISDESALQRWNSAGLGRTVIGSESLRDADFMGAARDENSATVLSLDFLGDEFKGPPSLLTDPERYWPQRVLAMNLQRVGSPLGPDFPLIVELAQRVPGCQVYAAGGVRSVQDLEQVARAGAGGALIASALHDGRIGSADVELFHKDS